MNTYVALDVETTGFSPDTCDIIELSGWKINDGVVIDKFDSLVRPVIYIPRTVQEITGITMDDVQGCEPIEVVLVDFFEFCGDYDFLGHNLPFDYSFLCTKGKRLGLDFSLRGSRLGIDTLKLSRKYLNIKSNKLEDVVKHFQIDKLSGGDYHRAYYDSYMTKLVYDRFVANYNTSDVLIPEVLNKDNKLYGKVENTDALPLD